MTRSVIDYVLLENLNLSLKRVKNVYFAGCLMFGRLDWFVRKHVLLVLCRI